MLGCFVLDDLQGANARALFAAPAQEEAAVAGRPEQDGAARGEIGVGVEVFGDPYGVLEHGRVDIVARIDIDAAIELNQLPGTRPVVSARFIEGFADEM